MAKVLGHRRNLSNCNMKALSVWRQRHIAVSTSKFSVPHYLREGRGITVGVFLQLLSLYEQFVLHLRGKASKIVRVDVQGRYFG